MIPSLASYKPTPAGVGSGPQMNQTSKASEPKPLPRDDSSKAKDLLRRLEIIVSNRMMELMPLIRFSSNPFKEVLEELDQIKIEGELIIKTYPKPTDDVKKVIESFRTYIIKTKGKVKSAQEGSYDLKDVMAETFGSQMEYEPETLKYLGRMLKECERSKDQWIVDHCSNLELGERSLLKTIRDESEQRLIKIEVESIKRQKLHLEKSLKKMSVEPAQDQQVVQKTSQLNQHVLLKKALEAYKPPQKGEEELLKDAIRDVDSLKRKQVSLEPLRYVAKSKMGTFITNLQACFRSTEMIKNDYLGLRNRYADSQHEVYKLTWKMVQKIDNYAKTFYQLNLKTLGFDFKSKLGLEEEYFVAFTGGTGVSICRSRTTSDFVVMLTANEYQWKSEGSSSEYGNQFATSEESKFVLPESKDLDDLEYTRTIEGYLYIQVDTDQGGTAEAPTKTLSKFKEKDVIKREYPVSGLYGISDLKFALKSGQSSEQMSNLLATSANMEVFHESNYFDKTMGLGVFRIFSYMIDGEETASNKTRMQSSKYKLEDTIPNLFFQNFMPASNNPFAELLADMRGNFKQSDNFIGTIKDRNTIRMWYKTEKDSPYNNKKFVDATFKISEGYAIYDFCFNTGKELAILASSQNFKAIVAVLVKKINQEPSPVSLTQSKSLTTPAEFTLVCEIPYLKAKGTTCDPIEGVRLNYVMSDEEYFTNGIYLDLGREFCLIIGNIASKADLYEYRTDKDIDKVSRLDIIKPPPYDKTKSLRVVISRIFLVEKQYFETSRKEPFQIGSPTETFIFLSPVRFFTEADAIFRKAPVSFFSTGGENLYDHMVFIIQGFYQVFSCGIESGQSVQNFEDILSDEAQNEAHTSMSIFMNQVDLNFPIHTGFLGLNRRKKAATSDIEPTGEEGHIELTRNSFPDLFLFSATLEVLILTFEIVDNYGITDN